jgi:hypothetical protein
VIETDKGGGNNPPLFPDSKDGSKPFESKTTTSEPSNNQGLQHPEGVATEGKDFKDPHGIDTNMAVRPDLDHKKFFGKDGKDFRSGKDLKDSKDGLFKSFAVPKGKFVKHDKKPGDVGPQGPVRNALGVAVVSVTPGKDASGPDTKNVSTGPIKNSIGIPISEPATPGTKNGKIEGPVLPHVTTNGPSINGTGMDKTITHTASIGGAKLNLQGISGNNVHYKH